MRYAFPLDLGYDSGYNKAEVVVMRLFITKNWHWSNIALLKWSALFIGMLLGAYFHEVVVKNTWGVVIVALLFALRPARSYWKDDD